MAVEQAAQEVRREEVALGADGLEFLAGRVTLMSPHTSLGSRT